MDSTIDSLWASSMTHPRGYYWPASIQREIKEMKEKEKETKQLEFLLPQKNQILKKINGPKCPIVEIDEVL